VGGGGGDLNSIIGYVSIDDTVFLQCLILHADRFFLFSMKWRSELWKVSISVVLAILQS
jgi:hypothetical protein